MRKNIAQNQQEAASYIYNATRVAKDKEKYLEEERQRYVKENVQPKMAYKRPEKKNLVATQKKYAAFDDERTRLKVERLKLQLMEQDSIRSDASDSQESLISDERDPNDKNTDEYPLFGRKNSNADLIYQHREYSARFDMENLQQTQEQLGNLNNLLNQYKNNKVTENKFYQKAQNQYQMDKIASNPYETVGSNNIEKVAQVNRPGRRQSQRKHRRGSLEDGSLSFMGSHSIDSDHEEAPRESKKSRLSQKSSITHRRSIS